MVFGLGSSEQSHGVIKLGPAWTDLKLPGCWLPSEVDRICSDTGV